MRIIIKFILTNIKEKKLRAFLIVFSIMASTALFFASSGTASTIKKTFTEVTKQYLGNADIQIYSNGKSPSPFISVSKTNKFRNRIDYAVGEIDANGTYTNDNKNRDVMLRGFNYEDVSIMNPLNFYKASAALPFSGNKIIVSKKSADKYLLKVGNKIKIKIGDSTMNFNIVGIAENTGFFAMESDKAMLGIVPLSAAQQINNAGNEVWSIYVKAKNKNDIDSLIKDLSITYKNYTVEKAVDDKSVEEQTGQIVMAFRAMMMVVLIMSMFIIYTVFKVVVTERLPVIGTFRSIGATRMTTSIVLIAESVCYGILGGIIGDFAGIGVLKLLARIMSKQLSDDFTINISIDYDSKQLITAFLFAIAVSFISSIVPIIKAARLSVKEVVLNTIDTVSKEKLWKFILGIIIIISSTIVPQFIAENSMGKSLDMVFDIISMIAAVIGVIIIVPYVTEVFVKIFEVVYGFSFGNEGLLAAKNLRKNKNLMNNISLLTIGISTLFMLNVVSYSMGKEIVKAYGIFKYNVWIDNDDGKSIDRTVVKRIKGSYGVSDAEPVYYSWDVELENSTKKISGIYFLSKYDIENYLDIKLFQDKNTVIRNFENGRNIIMTTTDLKKLNKKVGDYISIKTSRGNREYSIVGSFNTLMNGGSSAIIPKKYAKADFALFQPSFVYIKTYADSTSVKNALVKKFKDKALTMKTITEREKENTDYINKTLFLIRAFPILALIIGTVGVLNNFVISFMERKRSLAIYASVGMSKFQTKKMLFIESISIGVIGSICGIAGGVLMTETMPFILMLSDFPMNMHYSTSVFVMSFVLGILITVFASFVPALKSSKMNIIEAIKYE